MTCPGSVRLSRSAPPQVESRYAREGTEAHECLEFIVRRFKSPTARAEALKKWPVEMVDHAVNSAQRLFSKDLRPSREAVLLVEKRVVLRNITHRIYGTVDYAWLDHFGELVVVDYKYGAGVPVTPLDDDGKPNPQLMIYAYGIAEAHGWDFESVKLAIIQPRVWQNGEDPVSHATLPIERLREFGRELDEAVKAASHPNAPLVAGDHCRFCPALTTCPENSLKALEAANIVFDVDDGLQAAPSPALLTKDTLPKILKAADQIETWIRAVREHALRLAEDGEKIPGYKLVAKRATRVWDARAEEAAKANGLPLTVKKDVKLSPAQFEKEYGAKGKAFTRRYTASVSSGFKLVPENDNRSEVHTLAFDHE